MKYLTFIRHSESYRDSPPPAALMEAMGKFSQPQGAKPCESWCSYQETRTPKAE
jgi:hypothetical protein